MRLGLRFRYWLAFSFAGEKKEERLSKFNSKIMSLSTQQFHSIPNFFMGYFPYDMDDLCRIISEYICEDKDTAIIGQFDHLSARARCFGVFQENYIREFEVLIGANAIEP